MKRTILGTALVGLALFGFADDAAAQRPFRVGVIGGYNMASFDGDGAEGADSRSGFDIGGLIQIPMGEMITIQPEVHYSQRGASFEDEGEGSEVALDYIHVPVLLRAGVPLAEGFDFDFIVGPSFAFKMGCKIEPEDGDSVDCEETEGEPKSTSIGIIGGGSFAWAAGPGDVLVDVRYDWGLTNISDSDADGTEIKNTALQFLIGYAFPL